MDFHQLDADEVEENAEYFERVYALSEIAGLDPDQIQEDPVVADHADHADQVSYDLGRIQRTVEAERLPDEQLKPFHDVKIATSHLADLDYDGVDDSRAGAGTDEAVETVTEYVEQSLETDREIGYDTDVTSALFYAKYREQRLRAQDEIGGPLDQAYVLDVLDAVDIEG